MKKKTIVGLVSIVAAAALGFGLAACNVPSPCAEIAAPTARQLEVANETDHPTEVEKTVRGTECDLDPVTGTWGPEAAE